MAAVEDKSSMFISISNTENIDNTGSGLKKNWLIIVLAQHEGPALVAEEFEIGRYRGFFITNISVAYRCLEVLKNQWVLKK